MQDDIYCILKTSTYVLWKTLRYLHVFQMEGVGSLEKDENPKELVPLDENTDVDEVFENISIENCEPVAEIKKMEERCRLLESEAMKLEGTNDWDKHVRRRQLLPEYWKLQREMEYLKVNILFNV